MKILKTSGVYGIIFLSAILFTSCHKNDPHDSNKDCPYGNKEASDFINKYKGLPGDTRCELIEARLATEKYRDIKKATSDGYEDIETVLPNMGFHFMKKSIVNAEFNPATPEILVYNKDHNGKFELVAVEYAVPIELTPDHAPEGFTGSKDVWDKNGVFGLWLLHAWVWTFNPEGVFNPTNPSVHVHQD